MENGQSNEVNRCWRTAGPGQASQGGSVGPIPLSFLFLWDRDSDYRHWVTRVGGCSLGEWYVCSLLAGEAGLSEHKQMATGSVQVT
ncbi:unnamed protein product [Arctogadus glacialis]